MDIHVTTKISKDFKDDKYNWMDIGWSIGSCSNAVKYQLRRQLDHVTYTERCCLEPGQYTITCFNKRPEGWNGGSLELLGHQYCNDFVGFKAMRHLEVSGIRIEHLSKYEFRADLYRLKHNHYRYYNNKYYYTHRSSS